MYVHWHPDNLIFVKNSDNSVVFYFTKERLEQILNITLASLPQGIIERQYFPNSYTADFSANTQYAGPSNWTDGNTILNNIEILTEAFNLEGQ